MAGYIRQSSFSDGDTITAALFNNEYNQILNAFSNTSGHAHDGTAAEGPVIGLIGDAGETAPNNKVLIDTTNNYIEFYVQVSSSPVQQLYIADGAIVPVTDSDIDLGTTSLRFKDTYTDTVTTTGNVSVGGNLTVTGTTTFNGGTITMGDAATDNVVFGADVDSNIIPDDDDTYDLGSSSQQWRNLYVDGTANIDSLVADTADINGGTVDGAIIGGSSAAAITGTTITGTSFVIGSADINEAELETIDGVTAGTVAASKAIVVDSNKDFTGARNITLTGELDAGSLDVSGDVDVDGTLETDALSINGTAVTSTAAELNYLDISTLGTTEASKAVTTDSNGDILLPDSDKIKFGAGSDLQIYHDGSNSFVADAGTGQLRLLGDDVRIMNAAGTEISAQFIQDGEARLKYDNSTKLATKTGGIEVTGIITTDGMTTSGNVDFGDSDIARFGAGNDLQIYHDGANSYIEDSGTGSLLIRGTSLILEDAGGNDYIAMTDTGTGGTVEIKHNAQTKLATTSTGIDVTGVVAATSLDISGDVDVDGTLETDALTIGGVTLAETISDTVGAMVTSNTETGITVAYQDADNTLDFTIGTLNQDTTGNAATATALATARTIHGVSFDGTANIDLSEVVQDTVGAMFSSNTESGITVTYQDSDGTIDLTVGTLNQDTTGTAATVTTAAQPNITSLGTLTTLTVDDITINGSTISDAGDLTVDVGGDIILDADGTQIILKDGGTEFGHLYNTNSDFGIKSTISDKDIKFVGNDGGSVFTALTLDMSDAGTAIFNHDAVFADNGIAKFGAGSDLQIYHDGSNSYIKEDGTGNLNIQGVHVVLENTSGDNYFAGINGAQASIYHNGSEKLTTTSTGATTTGLHTSTQSANITQVAITSSSNAVAWDARAAANAYHVTTENTTFSAPSNAVEGAIISVEIAQGGTARTVAWNTVFEFAASTAPTVTATANKTDIFAFRYNGSVWQEIGRTQNMAQT